MKLDQELDKRTIQEDLASELEFMNRADRCLARCVLRLEKRVLELEQELANRRDV
jgi:hypothetical protein